VVVEAMGCGCPVIASDLQAIHDSILHEDNGLLVQPGNPDSLASAIIGLLSNSNFCAELSQKAKQKVLKQFDWEVISENYINLYQKIIIPNN
jgi:glycosyltransferase involved in cell wall biosynthesis